MTEGPSLSGKEAYEARRQERREVRIRQGLPRPQDTARQLPAGVLWTILVVGWLVAFGEALAVGLGLSWDWTPKIAIEANANHFASNPLGTSFRISNSGRIPLHNLHFGCVLTGHNTVSDNSPGQEPIETLAAGEDATKDCGTSFLKISPLSNIVFEVTYDWAFGKNKKATKYFRIKRGEDGSFFAVADVLDRPK